MTEATAKSCGQKGRRGCSWCRHIALLGVLVWQPATSAPINTADLVLVLPPAETQEAGTELAARGTLGDIPLFELSPENLADFASGELRVGIYSPYGFFPRYRVRARLLGFNVPDSGGLREQDVGMGVVDVVARRPWINPVFNYEPSTVDKNIDGEPNFRGTLNIMRFTPSILLYRTRGTGFGSWDYFTLSLAVGPQYFTPDPLVDAQVELTLEVVG